MNEFAPEPDRHGTRVASHGETWTHWALWNCPLDDEDCEELADTEYYRGPGQSFTRRGIVRRTKRRTLQLVSGGYDI